MPISYFSTHSQGVAHKVTKGLGLWLVVAGVVAAGCGGPTRMLEGDGGDASGIDARTDGAPRSDSAPLPDAPPGVDGGPRSDGGPMGGSEVCHNGLDDNGDGRIDEMCACLPGETQRCFPGPAGRAGIGACSYGMQQCMGTGEFGEWNTCEGAALPSGELCDGADNDCDGQVDNGCECRPDDVRGCYTGPAGTRGIGACRDGSQTCASGAGGVGSAWDACTGEVLPAMEVCDGVDNDCNGTVDDGCACTPGTTRSCYGGPAGTAGTGPCRAGTQTCNAAGSGATWGPCEMQVLPAAERCDGADNNCNGTVDDGCACRPGETRPCYEGPMSTRGVGLCADGTQTCASGPGGVGSAWGACTGQRLPSAEACDNLDNNCNGAIDDGCACRSGESRACYTGPAGTAGVGVCRRGTESCVVSGGVASWGMCTGQTLPAAEACDRVDNNCNGTVDDGCECTPGATRACYPGPAGTEGVGVCRAGSQTCVSGSGGIGSSWGACTGATLPGTERCNSTDDDCDGMIDEGCACRMDETRSCYGGPPGTQGVGVCRGGTQTCSVSGGTASWGTCVGEVRPQPELCDGIDNDCNGVIDNGCECTPGTTRSCYTGPAGTEGVGICRAGSQVCESGAGGVGSAWGACTGQTLPRSETCNMADDNCNGMIDDGLSCAGPTVTCPAPVRAPAGTTVTLTATATGSGLSYRWQVTSSPPGSTYTLGSPTTSSTTFSSVIVGTYTVTMTVTDSMGRTATCSTTVTMLAHGLRVELSWDTNSTDIDLHVHNRSATAWFGNPNGTDCYFAERNPRWDTMDRADDPALDVDDVNGFGPENIRVDSPVTTQVYTVGVHYWAGSPRTAATVRIYCGDTLAGTYMRTLRGGPAGGANNDFWRVGRVSFSSPSACTITPIDDVITYSASRTGNP